MFKRERSAMLTPIRQLISGYRYDTKGCIEYFGLWKLDMTFSDIIYNSQPIAQYIDDNHEQFEQAGLVTKDTSLAVRFTLRRAARDANSSHL